MKFWMAWLAGMVFGVGLSLGGMTQPAVVLGFLDLAGAWNPRLLFVMAGAVVTTAIGYRLVWRGQRPWFGASFQLPAARRVDTRLGLGYRRLLSGAGTGVARRRLAAGVPAGCHDGAGLVAGGEAAGAQHGREVRMSP
jgi:uncharacterized membrane protein YedE/YeeE